MSRLRLRPGSCRDIVQVEPVPACAGEEVQAASAADYPGARVIDVEGIAVADRVPRADLGVLRVVPDRFQAGGEPDDPVRAHRLLALSPAPAVVAVDSFVEIADPDLPGAGSQHVRDPVT